VNFDALFAYAPRWMAFALHAHAVENGVIRHLSVSQIKDLALCERVWFLSKVKHLPKKQFKSQVTGIEVHKQIEHYLKTGEDVLGDVARKGFEYLPAPGADLGVEASLEDPPLTAAGIPFEGYVDIINPRGAADGVLRLTDHKTSSNVEKYAASADDLTTTKHEHGIQMIGYARWAVLSGRYPWAKTIELEHLYYPTGTRKQDAKRVIARVPAQAFDAEWKRVHDLAERAKVLARAKSLDEVKPNWSACDEYGGCSFKPQCLIHQSSQGAKP
jgi:hypothetical protein